MTLLNWDCTTICAFKLTGLFWTATLLAEHNGMAVNFQKTKEMVMGPPSLVVIFLPIQSSIGNIEQVSSVKLLGLHLDANFSWRSHVEAMLSKATKHLYFLKLLKHAGVPGAQLQHFYVAVIRPILEYAAPVWHHLIMNCHSDQIEAIQKRAINIIHSPTHGMPYSNTLHFAGLTSLWARREQVACKFYESTTQPTSCLHHLLPPPRDPELLSRLRAPSKHPRTSNRTKKYQSFISFAISYYQTS